MSEKSKRKKKLTEEQWIRNPLGKRLYSIKEAAFYLGFAEHSVRELVWGREIPVIKRVNGRKIYLDIIDLDAYIERQKCLYA